MLLRNDKLEEAGDYASQAQSMNPDDGEYRGLWAYIQWRRQPRDADASELISTLHSALKINPNSERLHTYIAQMLKPPVGYLGVRIKQYNISFIQAHAVIGGGDETQILFMYPQLSI